ncbi:hypothetical protein JN06_01951 [Bacteroides zoogleoformans]|nr:hypothetical protein JN06_01951 [Bacteroides zoogleoformans]
MKLLFFCPLILKNVTKKEKPANIYDEDTKKHLLKNFKTDSKPKDISSPFNHSSCSSAPPSLP